MEDRAPMDVGQVLGAVRRHWILLLVVVLVGLAGGFARGYFTQPMYRSTTTVLFSLNRAGSLNELAEGNNYVQDLVPSYAKVVETPLVLEPVITSLNLQMSPGQLASKIE